MSEVDEVKQKIDIVEVIGQHVKLTKSGRNFRALCPFHSEKAPSFYVFPERQSWHCFGACNTGGDVFSFIMKQQGIDFGEALRLLAEQTGVTLPSRVRPDARKDERERLHQVNEAAATYFHDQLLDSPDAAKAQDYLLRRSFTAETVAAFQLGYGPDRWEALKQHLAERGYSEKELVDAGLLVETDAGSATGGNTRDRFRNRLMFPIHDARGRITGFGARVLDDSLPKYTNSPQTLVFDKSGTLYAVHLAAPVIRKQDRAILVEGYMDVITAHQNGFTNVIASMGTSITERQVTTLKRLTRNITLALDADAAGKEAMLRCVDYENTLDAEVQVMLLPGGRDPDDVIREDPDVWKDLIENAVPVVDYALDMTTAGLDLTTARDQARVIREFLPILARMKDIVRRDHYIRKLEIRTGTRYNVIEAALKDHMAASRPGRTTRKFDVKPTTPILSSPIEEECLSLLLQHPELKDDSEELLPDYFQNSQNREIFIAWQQSADLESLKERLDPSMWEQVDALVSRSLVPGRMEQKHSRLVLRLKKEHLREVKILEAAALEEASTSGTNIDVTQLSQEGIEANIQLQEVFQQEARANRSARDESGRVP
ncbi:MAG TPA: DNA primase [Dehalococcoidales bacterium]|nr:DNA primase [Dehalococcoidales bacterium]